MTTDMQATNTRRFDRALEMAVDQNWAELLPHSSAAQIHIEYQTDGDGGLEFLKIWVSAARGYWDLICEMWLQALWSNPVSFRFANKFHSDTLARVLGLITQDGGPGAKLPNHQGLIQLQRTTANWQTDATIPQTALAAA